jgi:hypothetical protein
MACKPKLSNVFTRGLIPTRTNRKVPRIWTLIGAASFFLLGLGLAHAQNTYTVTTTSGNSRDGCTGSSPTFECADLLDAIGAASAGDTINFSVSKTIEISNNVGIGNSLLTIDGTGQSITISGGAANYNGGAFVVNGGATLNLNALTFSNSNFWETLVRRAARSTVTAR